MVCDNYAGANSYGQLGLGHKDDTLLPQALGDFPVNLLSIRSITGGGGHSAVVTDTGELFVCGQNKEGQLGLNHTNDVLHFTLCTALTNFRVVQVACGWDFTIILTGDGRVWSCGSNSFGQLGLPRMSRSCVVPQLIEAFTEKVVRIAAGQRHALAATEEGLVFQWGTGMASQAKRACPGKPVAPFLAAKEPCMVTDAGLLYVWGSNKHGQLASNEVFISEPRKIEANVFSGERIGEVWSGWTHLVVQTETAKVFTWGRADYGQLGRNMQEGQVQRLPDSLKTCSQQSFNIPISISCLTGASQIACGSEHSLAVIGSQCYSWGWNEHGMCGNGTETNIHSPKPIEALHSTKPILIGCGAGHSMMLCKTTR